MFVFNFLKQLKKRLRWKLRWLALGAFLFLAGASMITYSSIAGKHEFHSLSGTVLSVFGSSIQPEESRERKEAAELIKGIQDKRETFVKRAYVCGEELQHLGVLGSAEIWNVHDKHPEWKVSLNTEGHVYFLDKIDDLSPECKQSAYFGIDKGGNLSLFNGMPSKENVIRTFFQLNIDHLESSLPREAVKNLYEGIRVKDLAEYNSVLSTYSDFAIEETEKVMSPQL